MCVGGCFNIAFGSSERVVCSVEKAHGARIRLPKALLKSSCGFIELFCDNIVPQITASVCVCSVHGYVQIISHPLDDHVRFLTPPPTRYSSA